jgi:photosystem II stability/assembly factor-like uncharacterized protein
VLAGTGRRRLSLGRDGEALELRPSPLDGLHILKIAQSPHDPDFIIAGTRPAECFRSRDNGITWTRLNMGNRIEAPFINTNRVTSLKFDPLHPQTIWATIEIDGLWRSSDAGETWRRSGWISLTRTFIISNSRRSPTSGGSWSPLK